MISLILLAIGLALLVGGADILVRGVKAIAQRLGVSPLVVGMTVVSFGTSTPEVAINLVAAVRGETTLAFGNIVGSCLANIGLVLALSAIARPLVVQHAVISREIPMLLLAAVGLSVLAMDRALGSATSNSIGRQDGVVLLLLFGVFFYYTVGQVIEQRNRPLVSEEQPTAPPRAIITDIGLTLGGLVGVALGGRLAVKGAVGLAQALGIPESVIGLTIVSFGTTLPELVTSVVAARKGMSDLAVGNVLGSCIFNTLTIGGLVSVISPIVVPPGGEADLVVLSGLSLLLLPIALRGPNRISRGEGVLLLLLYLTYTTWRVLSTGPYP